MSVHTQTTGMYVINPDVLGGIYRNYFQDMHIVHFKYIFETLLSVSILLLYWWEVTGVTVVRTR